MRILRHVIRIAVFLAIIAGLYSTAPLIEIPAHAEFSKQVSITGGSPAPRLFDALGSSGYVSGSQLDELTLCNPSANANSFYLGSASSVNSTTGFEIPVGVCITYRAGARPVDASRIFLYTSSTQNAAITLRER